MFELVRIEEIGEVQLRKGFGVLHPLAFASFEQGNLEKARSHKYIKREPYTTATGKKRYRYWYKMPQRTALVSQSSLKVGSAFKHGSGDEAGHFHITAVNGDKVTVRHDETGKEIVTNLATLKALLDSQAQPQTQQPPSKAASKPPKSAAPKTPTLPSSEATSKPPKSAAPSSTTPSSESFPVERATVESVLQQPPAQIAQDLNIYERYKQRDTIKDLRENNFFSSILYREAWSIDDFAYTIENRKKSFENLLEALYSIENGGVRLKITSSYTEIETEEIEVEDLYGEYGDEDVESVRSRVVTEVSGGFLSSEGKIGGDLDRKFIIDVLEEKKGVVLENTLLRVPYSMRGNSLSMQIYQRQEDLLRFLTKGFPKEEKEKVRIKVDASLSVGRYYWMSQGFVYKSHSERRRHINSMIQSLNEMAALDEDKSIDSYQYTSLGSKNMQSQTKARDVLNAGITKTDIQKVVRLLEEARDKKKDPWELLELDQDLPRFTYKKWDQEQGKHIDLDCGLIKYAALNGSDWSGIKYVHAETITRNPKLREGNEYAERKRAEDAEKAAAKGKPWTWLNLPE